MGTDCSGMDTPILALRNMGVGIDHVFSCDSDPVAVKAIRANSNPKVIYHDIKKRDNKTTPSVDLYIAGFPCQPFSHAGKREGFADKQGRGTLFFNILDYIKQRRPKIFLLCFTTLEKGKCMRKVVNLLKGIKAPPASGWYSTTRQYTVHHTLLNTSEHGLPHSRPRWYCIGIRRDSLDEDNPFQFPQPLPTCTPLAMLLDPG